MTSAPRAVALSAVDDGLRGALAGALGALGLASVDGDGDPVDATVAVGPPDAVADALRAARGFRLAVWTDGAGAAPEGGAALACGDPWGRGLLGRFRGVLAALRPGGDPAVAATAHTLAPLDVDDLAEAIRRALRFGATGVYPIDGGERAPAAEWAARAAPVLRAFGLPTRVVPPATACAPSVAPDVGRATREWDFRPRRTFEGTLAALLRARL